MVQGDYQWFIWSKVLKHLRLKGGLAFAVADTLTR